MGLKYKVDKTTILNFAKKIGYKTSKTPLLTDEEIKYVIDNYENKLAREIAEELNVSKSLITKIWREHGLKGKGNNSYHINENYFENIDSKDKAYILGVIASDGCVYKRENHKHMLAFKFHIQEEDIINIILKYMESNYKPYYNDNRITLQINSNKLVEDLEQYNITTRKTWSYYPTEIDNSFIWDYLRGYFDGDGCICCRNNGLLPSDYTISFCGNYKTMSFISDILTKNGIVHTLKQDNRPEKYSHDFYSIIIRENYSKYLFIKLLYTDCNDIKLNRKYNKCMEFIKIYKTPI